MVAAKNSTHRFMAPSSTFPTMWSIWPRPTPLTRFPFQPISFDRSTTYICRRPFSAAWMETFLKSRLHAGWPSKRKTLSFRLRRSTVGIEQTTRSCSVARSISFSDTCWMSSITGVSSVIRYLPRISMLGWPPALIFGQTTLKSDPSYRKRH